MQSDLLIARVEDTIEAAFRTDKPKFLGFLSCEEAVLVERFLENQKVTYSFYGGEHSAQRVMMGCFPDWVKERKFPITAITIRYRLADVLKHRDILGALMGLGLTRESVGDILIENGRAVIFLSEDIVKYVLENLQKVGRVGVVSETSYISPLPQAQQSRLLSATVASCRLDGVVSAFCNLSRNTANEYIAGGLVSVNSVQCIKATKAIQNGDIISVRRKGKFQVLSTENRSKKDRVIISYKSY